MGAASGDVLHRHPFVEIDGGRYDLHDGCGPSGEPAAPHRVRTHELPVNSSRIAVIVAAVVLAAAAIAGVLYVMQPAAVHEAEGPPPALAPFTLAVKPAAVPQVAIADASGARLSLAAFKGKYVLLNLW